MTYVAHVAFLLDIDGVVRGLRLKWLRPMDMEFEHCCEESGGLRRKGKRKDFHGTENDEHQQQHGTTKIQLGITRGSSGEVSENPAVF